MHCKIYYCERLDLYPEASINHELVDFSLFKALRTIEVEAESILAFKEDTVKPLAGRLPMSLQRLVLHYDGEDTLEFKRDSLLALEDPRTAQLPALEEMNI